MVKFTSAWRNQVVDCDVYRNNNKIDTHKGLIHDTKEYNYISFDVGTDIQIGDDIYCPLKNKHYFINNIDIALFSGKQHRLDVYFENNFKPTQQTSIFNTYNPTNSVIGNQQSVTLNINSAFKNLDSLIDEQTEDKHELLELKALLKQQLDSGNISKNKLSKFSNLIAKHSWLALAITQIIAAWIQQG